MPTTSPITFLFLLAAGCSFNTLETEPCSTNLDCREGFGYGSVCTDSGSCATAEVHPRCQAVYPENLSLPIDPATTYVVGTVFDHSLETHVGRYRSAQLAFKQANENGGLNGHDFAVIHCTNAENPVFDDLDKTAASVDAATWLADTVGVPAIVGPAASSRAEALYNEVSTVYGTLVVSPSATSVTLTPLGGAPSDADPGLLWRTAPPDDLQSRAISFDMLNNFDAEATSGRTAPSTNVGVIFQVGAYGDGLSAVFIDSHTAAGGTTTPYPFSNDSTRGDSITNALNGGHDELLFVSSDSTDVVAFLQNASTNPAVVDLPLFLTDAARNADVLAVTGAARDLLDQVRGSAPANPTGPEFDAFRGAYSAEYNGTDVSPLSFTAQSFDAAWLVAYGHAWAESNEPGIEGLTIARGFRKVSAGTPLSIRASSWNALKTSFAGGIGVNVTGASGPLDYDRTTGETSASIDIWTVNRLQDGFDIVDTVQ